VLTRAGFQRVTYVLAVIFLMIIVAPVTWGAEKIFPLDKVKPGMDGYGYTVFSGTKIEKFKVKVIATVEGSFGKNKLILVRLLGKSVEENGGLSAGMSGSPIYLNDCLAGAISYGFENADSTLALVTPISSMFQLLNENQKVGYLLKGYNLKAVPVATPVMVSGMKRRGFELMAERLKKYDLQAVFVPDAGVSSLEMGKGLIRPGSAIAVLMSAGDYQVSAIGTVTWLDGKDFLAFGHAYNNRGNVDYFAYQANILQTVKSSQMSFKLGAPLKLIGRITQDRQSGIVGRLEETPAFIPVRINIKDNDRNLTKKSTFYVLAGEQVFHDLIISGVTDAIDQAIDRVGAGSAKVNLKIETIDGQEQIIRDNLFYSKDIAVASIKDLDDLLTLIHDNDYSRIVMKGISVNMELDSEHTAARIVKIVSESSKPKPGDTVRLSVLLHKYRGDDITVPIEFKLPAGIKPGKLTLTVCGGSREAAGGSDDDAKKDAFKLNYKNTLSFQDLLANFLAQPKNNELVLEYDPTNETKAADETSKNNSSAGENAKQTQVKSLTQYYILGEAQVTVEVQL
jgi:hypothetical protein